MIDYKKFAKKIDDIADKLDASGYIEEAEELDGIANLMDKKAEYEIASDEDKDVSNGDEELDACGDRLSSVIDKVASALESKGFIKEAEELDIISNTLDRLASPLLPPMGPGEKVLDDTDDSKLKKLLEESLLSGRDIRATEKGQDFLKKWLQETGEGRVRKNTDIIKEVLRPAPKSMKSRIPVSDELFSDVIKEIEGAVPFVADLLEGHRKSYKDRGKVAGVDWTQFDDKYVSRSVPGSVLEKIQPAIRDWGPVERAELDKWLQETGGPRRDETNEDLLVRVFSKKAAADIFKYLNESLVKFPSLREYIKDVHLGKK